MAITSALVLFSVIWFVVFFVVLPIRLVTQSEAGEVVPGTHGSAPANPQIGRKARITTVIALAIWAVAVYVILYGGITARDLDFFGRMTPPGG